MARKSNITFSLDDVAIDAAKAYAAKRGTTLNKIVTQYFLSLAANDDMRVPVLDTTRALLRYSNGQASMSETVDALGVNDGGTVLQMLREQQLPAPVLERSVAEAQAEAALALLEHPHPQSVKR
jgi:ABC-type amino acid transport substrate-binding protein